MSILNDFKRVRKGSPCLVCGKPDWCLTEYDQQGDAIRSLCKRKESPIQWGRAGYLHKHRDQPRAWSGPRTIEIPRRKRGRSFLPAAEDAHRRALRSGHLNRLAELLGVSDRALAQLHAGSWKDATTFPMRDAAMGVIGIRLRWPDGTKKAFRGSRSGLFIPADLDVADELYVVEGPTDCAALLSIGLPTIARPSCHDGDELVRDVVRRRGTKRVVFIADRDEQGRRGAWDAARLTRLVCASVRVIIPPAAVHDVRDWVRAGATADDVRVIEASAIPLSISVSAPGE